MTCWISGIYCTIYFNLVTNNACSKIETGKVSVSNEVFNVTELVCDITGIFRGTIERKGLQLSLLTDPNLPHFVVGDPGKTRQIVST